MHHAWTPHRAPENKIQDPCMKIEDYIVFDNICFLKRPKEIHICGDLVTGTRPDIPVRALMCAAPNATIMPCRRKRARRIQMLTAARQNQIWSLRLVKVTEAEYMTTVKNILETCLIHSKGGPKL
jgi:hypothetical protein